MRKLIGALMAVSLAVPLYGLDKSKLTEIICTEEANRPKYHMEGGLNPIDFVPGYTHFTVQTLPFRDEFIIAYHMMDIGEKAKNEPAKLVLGTAKAGSGDFPIYRVKDEDRPEVRKLFPDPKVLFFECK